VEVAHRNNNVDSRTSDNDDDKCITVVPDIVSNEDDPVIAISPKIVYGPGLTYRDLRQGGL